ncbi:hypothetical protein VTK56DRAFT_7733 [Thermocarpiscus australiensis]
MYFERPGNVSFFSGWLRPSLARPSSICRHPLAVSNLVLWDGGMVKTGVVLIGPGDAERRGRKSGCVCVASSTTSQIHPCLAPPGRRKRLRLESEGADESFVAHQRRCRPESVHSHSQFAHTIIQSVSFTGPSVFRALRLLDTCIVHRIPQTAGGGSAFEHV